VWDMGWDMGRRLGFGIRYPADLSTNDDVEVLPLVALSAYHFAGRKRLQDRGHGGCVETFVLWSGGEWVECGGV
jgi:hypothetical protein